VEHLDQFIDLIRLGQEMVRFDVGSCVNTLVHGATEQDGCSKATSPRRRPASGPGEKFTRSAPCPRSRAPLATFSHGETELPEAYGTKKLFLTARDPHWLYAHWDLTREQQAKLNAKSTDGHLVLRIYAAQDRRPSAYEIHVHPESRHWFAHVERAGNSYAAELGYYSALGKWMRVAISSGTVTPPDAASPRPTPNSPPSRLNFRSPN
jgi:hypothetical protein